MSHSFPPVEALEFETSLILVPLLYDLKNYDIVGSALSGESFLIINLIEQGYLLVVGYPMIFQILHSSLMVLIGGVVVGVSYDTPELQPRFEVAFNAIHRRHQPSMNLKIYFISTIY
jgi:hypothetical protein